jgi:fatty-acyl-CoA synthase
VKEVGRRAPGALSAAKAWLRALELTGPISAHPRRTLPLVIDELAAVHGDALALLSDRERLSYRALAERSHRYARWALAQGLARGDAVCLLMPNRPEFMAIWLGLTRAGGIVALLNTRLVGSSLAHCIRVAAPAHIIVAAELVDALRGACPALAAGARVWVHGAGHEPLERIDEDIELYAGDALTEAECALPHIDDRALYIYTSGTTGMPKAANVTHSRVMQWSHWFTGLMDIRPDDRMYNCLPMYHSVGGVAATGAMLAGGGSVVVREGFAANRFWEEILHWDCTLFQYIGELCRYLLNTAPVAQEARHRIRLCCGNGLRPDVWEAFKLRFRIPRILEFYAATEGNFSLYNLKGKPGAIGRIPPMLAHRFPAALVRFDVDTETPVRDGQGRCIRCMPNEVGEAIGRISADPGTPGGRFDGYTDREATEHKILRDVFESGDAWFRTGDLMRRDEEGWFYFVDRIGDTFRWKGENVSTTEVEQVICAFAGIKDASIYGVTVPGSDGRAGMAALVCDGELDLVAFRQHLAARLPVHAHPLFLRLQSEIEETTTFKHAKRKLVHQGYDPAATRDAIYFNDLGRRAFIRVDAALYERILTGHSRL